MKSTFIIFLLLSMPFILFAAPDNEFNKLKDLKGKKYGLLKGYPRSLVKRGKQGSVKLKAFPFDIGLGTSTSYLLEFVTKRKKTIEIALSTGSGGGNVYIPIYILLDANYKFVDVAKPVKGA